MSTPQTSFVEDGLNNLSIRPVVGMLFSPDDAFLSIRHVADAVLKRRGGHGALRELVEGILQVLSSWGRLPREGWEGGND